MLVPRDRIELSTPAFSGRGSAKVKTRGKGQVAVGAEGFSLGGPAEPAPLLVKDGRNRTWSDERDQGRVGHA